MLARSMTTIGRLALAATKSLTTVAAARGSLETWRTSSMRLAPCALTEMSRLAASSANGAISPACGGTRMRAAAAYFFGAAALTRAAPASPARIASATTRRRSRHIMVVKGSLVVVPLHSRRALCHRIRRVRFQGPKRGQEIPMIHKKLHVGLALLLLPACALAFETVDTIIYPNTGRFAAYPVDEAPKPWNFFAETGVLHDSNIARISSNPTVPPAGITNR